MSVAIDVEALDEAAKRLDALAGACVLLGLNELGEELETLSELLAESVQALEDDEDD